MYWIPDPLQEKLHQVDQQASGRVQIAEEVTNPSTRDRYLVNSLIEEAITSSQLEGASTTHKVAKAMLRESRRPRDTSERMIFNNYHAMSFIREVAKEPLSPDLILELHKIVTEDTLEDPSAVGRFRNSNEEVAVYDNRDNTLLHEPPEAGDLGARIEAICKLCQCDRRRWPVLASGRSLNSSTFHDRIRPPVRRWKRSNRSSTFLLVYGEVWILDDGIRFYLYNLTKRTLQIRPLLPVHRK